MQYRLYVHEKGPSKGVKEPGIYTDTSRRRLYLRIRGGRDSFISVGGSVTKAKEMRDTRRISKVAAKLGIAVDADKASQAARATVERVIHRYQADGYPDKKGRRRKRGKHRSAEESYCETLLKYFNGKGSGSDLEQHDLDEYHDWRIENIAAAEAERLEAKGIEYNPEEIRKLGHRITDLELNTLNNAMRWAVRKRMLRSNPIASRARYYCKKDAKHCREFAPESADELHEVAGFLMSNRRSEALGWQLLFEGMTGLRCEEVVQLRMDALSGQPGWITPDGRSLRIKPAEKSDKASFYIEVNDGFEFVLASHKVWKAARYPNSPWFLPGRKNSGLDAAVDKSALTKALDRLYRTGVLKKKYTSHGAGRAFFVLVCRSRGLTDTQIAAKLNQTGGVSQIEQVYGLIPEHWKNGNGPKLSWIPTGAPAWSKIKSLPALSAPPSYEI
jgi:hypothetical protein